MSELSFTSKKSSSFSSTDLLADFFHVCFFILSHPLYFSYFIFFSPYILKVLSFISPLIITTSLVVLAYLTISPNSTSDLPKIKVGSSTCCIVKNCQNVVAKLQDTRVDQTNVVDDEDYEEFRSFEELEVYRIVFDTSSLEVRESSVDTMSSEEASEASTHQSYSLEGNGSIGYFIEAASQILEEIRNNPVEEMKLEQVFDAPIHESCNLEGDGKNTDQFLDGAIWEEKEENLDEKKSMTRVFDAAFDGVSSPESSDSSGYFSEASSVAKQKPVEKACSSQVSDTQVEGNESYFFEASSEVLEESRETQVGKICSSQVSDALVHKSSRLEGKESFSLIQKAVEEKKDVKALCAFFNKVEDGEPKRLARRESKDKDLGGNDGGFRSSKSMVKKSQFLGSNIGSPNVKAIEASQVNGPNLGSFGSMRKEKEWRRTLACKLFEERHNNSNDVEGGGEGMDMLWETHDEKESSKADLQGMKSKSKKLGMKINGNKVDYSEVDVDEEGEEELEDEEELDNAQLCCLQALKFSAGKMNLGHKGRPNLVKITKALKGFGWLHHATKHSKKGYN